MAGPHDPVSLGSPRFASVEHGAFQVTSALFPSRLQLPPHTHERSVFAVTLGGRWTSILGGRTYESTPGYLLTEPAGDRHANHFLSSAARVLIVQPDPAADDLLRPCRRLLTAINHRLSSRVLPSASRLAGELRHTDDLSPLAIQGLCLELLSSATREFDRGDGGSGIKRVEDYLRAHFRDCPSLDRLAAVADVHPAHLTRAFRRRHGTAPAQFVRGLRLEWAAARLRDTRRPIAEIAQLAGFSDQSHFTRLFRRAMGMTPSRYRVAFATFKTLETF